MMLTVFANVIAIGALHSVVLALVVWLSQRGNRRANFCLAILLCMYGLDQLLALFFLRHWFTIFPCLPSVPSPIIFTYGPLLYLFVHAYVNISFHFQWRHALHFIPALVVLGYNAPLILCGRQARIVFYWRALRGDSPAMYVIIMIAIIHAFVYVGVILARLKRHNQEIEKAFSNTARVCFSWLAHLLVVNAVVWSLVGMMLFGLYMRLITTETLIGVIYLCVAGKVFIMGYRGLLQPEIFIGAVAEANKKYEKTALAPAAMDQYLQQLIQVVEQEKPYLEPELTLQQLAERMAIPAYQLSQVINEKMQLNFFQFINQYRVNEAKLKLTDTGSRQEKLLKIAFDAGFNSIATFNRVFKSMTGVAPSQFRKSNI